MSQSHRRAGGRVLYLFSTRVSLNSLLVHLVQLEVFDVEALRVVDGAIPLSDAGNDTAVLSDELSSPVTNVTEPLDDESGMRRKEV